MLWMLIQMCTSNPQNLKACMTDQHIWLWPEVWRGVELYMRWELPYQEEAGRLEDVNLEEDPNDSPQPRRRS